ncbi:manganese superoxide dismutase [Rhodotorula sp. JG-1b]|nr:manganese superoxide dismutase [Rhodotorula sp. JG-1b]
MSAFNKLPAVLPQLAYPYNALEPAISAQIMELHHSKHHQTYVTNLNKAQEDYTTATQAQDIKKQIALQAAIKFNGGGHINHTLFWENLAPQSSGGGQFPSSGKLYDQVQQDFGGLDGLKKAVNTAALGIQGSGWAWLGYNPQTKKLETVTTANQDPLLGYVPIVGVDMWEHAYYIDYKNVKATYLDNIWSVINWKKAEERLASA